MVRHVVVTLVALLVLPSVVSAQQPRVYAAGTFTSVTQTHSVTEPLGGTTWGGSVLFGVQVSPRMAVEFEPSFEGPYSWEYTYRPGPSWTAHVVASRRDTFFSFQLRTRVGVLEPVVGVGYVHARVSRHATVGSSTYFDDGRSDDGIAAVGGLDAPVKLASHFFFVPTFRVLVRAGSATQHSFIDPLGEQTSTGPFVFRYGAGARVTF
jgi:hypothetical protein